MIRISDSNPSVQRQPASDSAMPPPHSPVDILEPTGAARHAQRAPLAIPSPGWSPNPVPVTARQSLPHTPERVAAPQTMRDIHPIMQLHPELEGIAHMQATLRERLGDETYNRLVEANGGREPVLQDGAARPDGILLTALKIITWPWNWFGVSR